jgi:hypothetical protein
MAADLATLGLRLTNAQAIADAKATGAALEEMGVKGEAAAGKIAASSNPVTTAIKQQAIDYTQLTARAGDFARAGASAAQVSQMAGVSMAQAAAAVKMYSGTVAKAEIDVGGLKAAQAQLALANMAVGESAVVASAGFSMAGAEVGRLRQSLASAIAQMTGVPPIAARIGSTMGVMALGMGEVVGAMLAIGAAVWVYDKITEGARKASAEVGKLTDALAAQFLPKTGPRSTTNLEYNAALQQQADAMRHLAWLQGPNTTAQYLSHGEAVPFQNARKEIETQTELLRKANVALGDARVGGVMSLPTVKTESTLKAQTAERLAAERKVAEAAKRYAEEGATLDKEVARLKLEMQLADLKTLAEAYAEITKNAMAYTMPHVGINDSLTKEQIKQRKAMGIDLTGGEDQGGGIFGGVAGAFKQFAPQAIVTSLVTTGINYIAKGFMDLASSMLDGGAAARAYALAMKTQRDEYAAGIAQFQHDDLAAKLAQNLVSADQLMKQAQELYGSFDAIWQAMLHGGGTSVADAQAAIKAAAAKNAEMIKQQAAQVPEDLQVRLLAAQGKDQAAAALKLQLAQARERQALIDSFGTVVDPTEAATLALLDQVQAQEKLKAAADAVSGSMLNMVAGYKLQATIFAAMNPGGPLGALGGGGGVGGGGADTSHGGLKPPGGGIPSNRMPSGDLTVPLVLNGSVVAKVVLKDFRNTAQKQFGDSNKWSSIQ